MLDLLLSPQAVLDLEDIYIYTFKTWGLKQAEKYQDELFERMVYLKRNPNLGSEYLLNGQRYRQMKVNRHLIFYRTDQKNCIVVRVLNERMELERNLDLT